MKQKRISCDVDISFVKLDNAISELIKAKEYLIKEGCSPDTLQLDIGMVQVEYSPNSVIEIEAFGFKKEKNGS